MLRLAHLSIKITNLQAESALSTATPPPFPVTITAYHHASNPRRLSASTQQTPFSAICFVALLVLTAETAALVAVGGGLARRSVRTRFVL